MDYDNLSREELVLKLKQKDDENRILLGKSKLLREKLRNESRMLRNILDNVALGVCVLDGRGNIKYANDTMFEISGDLERNLLGKNIFKLPSYVGKKDLLNCAHLAINKSIFSQLRGVSFVSFFGEKESLRNYTFIPYDGKKKRGIVLIEDVFTLEQVTKQLIHAQKMECIGQLAAGVAHNFNQILTVIKGYVELVHIRICRQQDSFSEELKFIEKILESTNRAAFLANSLLMVSGKSVPKIDLVDVTKVLGNIIAFSSEAVPGKISLKLYVGNEKMLAFIDAIQLEQVFLNLILNSVDAMPSGGEINVNARIISITAKFIQKYGKGCIGKYIKISVIDNGKGISDKIIQKIFEPFFTTKEFGKGTGLGLSMSNGMIEGHGGFITVKSKVGKGTMFDVFLPLAQEKNYIQ
jgi:signal transduction histidine kinase